MKNLTLIVHADIQQPLADVLRGMNQVSEFTFTQVQGHGPQDERDPQLSARDFVVGYTPHVRVDIVLDDRSAEEVLETLRTSDCGLAGRCVYWVTPVTDFGAV